ncbi:hypothetical protein L1987_69152 [Smallanthus sonchifolius]|uniref:Uncharacterized protein n=1 Tax=Smallanthus sonchifolius TaxID=185202 RepID=A0ACB9B7C6_9ASTR|nr:hypothetical protein L1987_69152 [Smallanthus sonchifolius]
MNDNGENKEKWEAQTPSSTILISTQTDASTVYFQLLCKSIKEKPPLRISIQRHRKISKGVCFALEDATDTQKRGSGAVLEDRPEVADDVHEDALVNNDSDNRSALYDFLYPDKELLPEDKEMTIFDHLEELRERIFVSVLAVGAAIVGCFVYSKDLIMILEAPVRTQGVRFLQLAPGEFFFTTIKGVVESLWSIDQYFEFILVLMFSTGLSFQVPVIQLVLGQVGLVSGDQMLSVWRYVVVGAVVAAAIVTPSTDPLTQILLAGPLLGLYFGGAWTVKLIGK